MVVVFGRWRGRTRAEVVAAKKNSSCRGRDIANITYGETDYSGL